MFRIDRVHLPLLLALFIPGWLYAAAGDPVYVEADRVEINERSGTSRYQGQVVLRQAGLTINAEELKIQRSGETIETVHAEGNPVVIEQQATEEQPRVRGEALRIVYDPQQGKVTLDGEARVQQGNDEFSGSHIIYDARRNTVVADGQGDDNGRVKMIIRPETTEETEQR